MKKSNAVWSFANAVSARTWRSVESYGSVAHAATSASAGAMKIRIAHTRSKSVATARENDSNKFAARCNRLAAIDRGQSGNHRRENLCDRGYDRERRNY